MNLQANISKRLRRILIRGAVYYSIAAGLLFLFQRSLIFQPVKLGREKAVQLAAEAALISWTNRNGEAIGWRVPAGIQAAGAVLIFHGNAGWAGERDYLTTPIRDGLALDVFILEYPGYGARAGQPNQRTILNAAEDAFDQLKDRRPLYLVSESLGAGPAAWIAGKHPDRITGMLLFAPYNNLAAVGQRHLPFLPIGLLLRDRLTPDAWLRSYTGPMGVVLASRDEVIAADLGRTLFEGLKGRKKLWVVNGAGHNDIADQDSQWWAEVHSFWRGATAEQSPQALPPPRNGSSPSAADSGK